MLHVVSSWLDVPFQLCGVRFTPLSIQTQSFFIFYKQIKYLKDQCNLIAVAMYDLRCTMYDWEVCVLAGEILLGHVWDGCALCEGWWGKLGLLQQVKDLFARLIRPTLVGDGTGGAGVQNATQGKGRFRDGRGGDLQLLQSIGAHADEAGGAQPSDGAHQMALTGGLNPCGLLTRELGRGYIGAAFAHPDKRAVVGYVGLREEALRCAVKLLEKPPQSSSAHF